MVSALFKTIPSTVPTTLSIGRMAPTLSTRSSLWNHSCSLALRLVHTSRHSQFYPRYVRAWPFQTSPPPSPSRSLSCPRVSSSCCGSARVCSPAVLSSLRSRTRTQACCGPRTSLLVAVSLRRSSLSMWQQTSSPLMEPSSLSAPPQPPHRVSGPTASPCLQPTITNGGNGASGTGPWTWHIDTCTHVHCSRRRARERAATWTLQGGSRAFGPATEKITHC
mmetsp:Transcript_67773/g.134459  ORF Transcript_67773/g.134459 Transcript_67773/m.134459 type:complete len:221 (+) Transcript_67773:540-1202(+)